MGRIRHRARENSGAQHMMRKSNMHGRKPKRHGLMLIALSLALTACAQQPSISPVASPPQVPALPAAARQRATPDYCSLTCSAGAASELRNWRDNEDGPILEAAHGPEMIGRAMASGFSDRRVAGQIS
jgi:hypothetical protein